MIFTLLSKVISGAVVGYITNDLAIQMLFRKRFGLGGIVIRTKDEFILNISKLVEREIINHHTIEKEINNAPELLANAIEQISADFFDNQLFIVFPTHFKIGDIAGIEDTYSAAINNVPTDDFVRQSIDFIFTHTPVTHLLSDNQLDFTLHSLSNELNAFFDTPTIFQQTLQSAYNDLHYHTLVDLLPLSVGEKVVKNLASSLQDSHKILKDNFDQPITDNIHQISDLLRLNELIKKISEQIVQRKLHHIFGKDNTENISEELNARLLQIVNSEEGKKMITSFADFLVQVLENEKTTIFELLSDDLAQNFDNFLHTKLPTVLKNLIMWLEERKDKLELLIDATFKNNVKSRFQDLILRFFVGSVSQYANIVNKMTEIIEQHRQNPEETADRLTEQLINFLKSNTIGNIITQLKNNPTFLQKVDIGSLLIENINLALGKNAESSVGTQTAAVFNVSTFFERPLSDFVSAYEIEQFLQKSINQLIDNQLKNNFLYHEKFSYFLAENLELHLRKLFSQKMGEILPSATFGKMSDFISKNLHNLLQSKQNELIQFFTEIIAKQLNGKTWADFITPSQTEKWSPFIRQATDNLFDAQFKKLKQKEVSEYITQFNQLGANKQVPVFLQNTLMQNLPSLLTGKVEIAVQSSMHKMETDKLRDLVEKFMGKELKPITLFGAFLGALAGVGLYALPSDNLLDLTNLGIASLAYGITGYGTNWLALKMIFRPYYQQYFPMTKIPVPFTPGVAAKNQGRFAQNMGKFVVNGLLNKAHLTDTFHKNKEKLRLRIIEFFSANDFEFLQKQVEKNRETWSKKGGIALFETVENNQQIINQTLGKVIDENEGKSVHDFPQAEKFATLIEKQIIEYSESERFHTQLQRFLNDSLLKVSQNPNTLDSLVSPKIKENALPLLSELIEKQLISLFETLEKRITDGLFDKNLIPFDDYSEKTLNYYIKPAQKEIVREKISHTLRNKLIDNEIKQVIFKFIDDRLGQELSPEKKISELFGGNLVRIIQENIDNVVDNLIKFGLSWLKSNGDSLSDLVYEKAYQESKAAALYKDPIKNTVKELAEDGIPFFFKKESGSLKELVANGVQQIGESPMAQLKLNIDNEYLKKIVEGFLKREEILEAIQRLLDMLIEEIFKLPISVFLKILSIHEVGDLKKVLEGEIKQLSIHLAEVGLANTKGISEIASELLIEVAEKHLTQTEITTIFRGITSIDFQEVAKNWTKLISEGKVFQQFKNALIKDFLAQIKHQRFDKILNSDILKEDIGLLIKQLITKPETKVFFTAQFTHLIEINLQQLVSSISPETKTFLINQLTEAALNSLENNLDTLLSGIDLKKIVETEVSTMQPKEIEGLFYSFADKYFTQLINYGFGFGIVFGLLVDFILMFALQLLTK